MKQHGCVFLIDDDPVFAAVACVVFESAGAKRVSSIGNTNVALENLALEAKYEDLAVLSLNMRGNDGLAVMRILAEAKFKGSVAVSSSESSSIREAALRLAGLLGLRVAGELGKPLREEEATALLSQALHISSPKSDVSYFDIAEASGLCPVYQAKVDSVSGSIVGGEALMRLVKSDGTLHSPQSYIEMITTNGQLAPMTLRFLDLVLDDLAKFKKAGQFPIISVNVPATVAEQSTFPAEFAAKVRSRGVSPSQITIELTESALPADASRLVEVLTRLRMVGFGLALDDFGTGMANFDMLRMCPFSELKVDRSLAQASVHDALSCGIIETCATISRELGMTLVAEGIETEEQEMTLKRLGVTVFQGFLFGRGLGAEEFLSNLNSNLANPK